MKETHPHLEHRARAPRSVACSVITVSDSRTAQTDDSGRAIRAALEGAGHTVPRHLVVKDDPEAIRAAIRAGLEAPEVQAVITNGGTGISRRDSTYEVARSLLDKELPGFGEIFRALSYQEIGPAAIMSRATAGVAAGKVLIALPGSPRAADLALAKLILPELPHMVHEVNR